VRPDRVEVGAWGRCLKCGNRVKIMSMEATADQFTFMEAVPVLEPSPGSLAWARIQLSEFEQLNKEHGCLLTGAQAAEVLGVGRERIRQLADAGKLQRFDLKIGVFYSGNDVKARLDGKPKAGRPRILSGLDRSP
jgi:hypothetical protein